MPRTLGEYVQALEPLNQAETLAYLQQHSDLPGPRANLTLIVAAVEILPAEWAVPLTASEDEYLACCGVATLGRLLAEEPGSLTLLDRLTHAAADERWRVREAAAIAGQRLGDARPDQMRALVAGWTEHSNPLVVRAAIATICEPRLVNDPDTAAAALTACARATDVLMAVPAAQRRDPEVRVLRKGLAYCWSVAIVAAPKQGLAAFEALDRSDPDVDWVVRQNLSKNRLKRIIDAPIR